MKYSLLEDLELIINKSSLVYNSYYPASLSLICNFILTYLYIFAAGISGDLVSVHPQTKLFVQNN